jgi:hypothetical protein
MFLIAAEVRRMRKMICTLLMLVAVVAAFAGPVPRTEAAQSVCTNPGPNCECHCECGQLLKCCTSDGVPTCEAVYDPADRLYLKSGGGSPIVELRPAQRARQVESGASPRRGEG